MLYSDREKGKIGETAAVDYLIKNGYTILDRNFRTRYGEIDIVGEDDGYIAFIEVKCRKDFKMGLPCESVNFNKQNRIARMALMYISMKGYEGYDFRFDIVELVLCMDEIKYIHLIKDAFQVNSL